MFRADKILRVSIVTVREAESELLKLIGSLSTVHLAKSIINSNTYKPIDNKDKQLDDYSERIREILKEIPKEYDKHYENNDIDSIEDLNKIDKIIDSIEKFKDEISDLSKENILLDENISKLSELKDIDIDIKKWGKFNYLFFTLGHIPNASLSFLEEEFSLPEVIFVPLRRIDDKLVLSVISYKKNEDRIMNVLNNLFYVPAEFPKEYAGRPKELIKKLNALLAENKDRIDILKKKVEKSVSDNIGLLLSANRFIKEKKILIGAHENLGFTAKTVVVTGYIKGSDVDDLSSHIDNDLPYPAVLQTFKPANNETLPVVLKNPKSIKAFELLTDTYGHPQAGEIDPTPILAITYPFMFGLMFGDVGQGAIVAILGFLLYRFARELKLPIQIGKIAGFCGVSSVIFGFLYGSIFGNEEIIKPILFSPISNMEFFFKMTIGFGIVYLLLSISISSINHIIRREGIELFFNKFGVFTFLLYSSMLGLAFAVFIDKNILIPIFLWSIFLISLIFIFREFIVAVLLRKKGIYKYLLPMHLFEGVMELVEIVLNLISSTVSFLRLAAFAIGHGALMGVIYYIAESMGGGSAGLLAIIVGNIFIIILEGVIVSIQALRLEYYEFFSKFYEGGGEDFTPFSLKGENE